METHLDPARGKKKTALPPGISRKRKARIDARSSQTTRTQPQIPYNCIDARKTRKLRSHATGIFPRFTRAHIFFLDQKRPKCRRGGKKFTGNRARTSKREERVRAKTARYQSSMRTERGKERRDASICSSRTIFVYLRFSFVFFLRAKSVKRARSEKREREREREMKNRKSWAF